jgi:hypothetical protein
MEGGDEVRRLLDALNEWERSYGRGRAGTPLRKDRGEVSARSEHLRQQLAGLGVRVRWDGDRYVAED